MTIISLSNKQKGCFLGLAVGDALGAPIEFCFRDRPPHICEMTSGGKFNLPAGAWTDDTSMALCLADSLYAHPSFDAKDLLTRFWLWASEGENSSTGKAIGFGQNILQALFDFYRSGTLKAGNKHRRSDGNGSIMRLAPLMVLYPHDQHNGKRVAREQSETTHASSVSADGCECLLGIVQGIFSGQTLEESLASLHIDSWHEDIQNIAKRVWKTKTRDEIKSDGYVAHTLEAAVWCVANTSTFEEALVLAINLAHDADTVGAVTGQIAGALYGYSSIPSRWLSVLAKREFIESKTETLITLSRQNHSEKITK